MKWDGDLLASAFTAASICRITSAAGTALYGAGNFGMQRRRVQGVLAHPEVNPRALMDDEAIDFTKEMETIDAMPGHEVVGAGV